MLNLRPLIVLIVLLLLPLWGNAASKIELDAEIDAAVDEFYVKVPAGKKLAAQAKGMLVFPSVVKAGFIVGGEYGEGALIINGKTVSYYSITAGSLGLQAGAQVKNQIILFMTPKSLEKFRRSDNWVAGVDSSVALATMGAGGKINTETYKDPVIGFVFSNKGLMVDVSFEGSKISPIVK